VKDLHKSKKETTSLVLAGLSSSSGAKGEEQEESSLYNSRELSTLDLTSSAKPFAGTPLEGEDATLNTGDLSLQSSTLRKEYLFTETGTGESTEGIQDKDFFCVFTILWESRDKRYL